MSKKNTPSGGGLSRGGNVRVRTAARRSAQSTRWLARQLNDPYVHKAKQLGYRSRAAFKLAELDESYSLLRGAQRIVDLGASPGGWCQVAKERCPKAHVVAIDLLEFDPLPGVTFFQQDFLAEGADQALIAALGGLADVVLSDMAANTTGHKQTDHLRTMALCEAAVEFAERVLRPGGHFVAKVLAGGADKALVATLKTLFSTVKHAKPPASRKDSSEWYVIGLGFKAPKITL